MIAACLRSAAMLEHQVLQTIAVGRHVLLIADVRAGPGLAGSFITDTEQDGRPGCSRCRPAGRPRSTGPRAAATCSRPATG